MAGTRVENRFRVEGRRASLCISVYLFIKLSSIFKCLCPHVPVVLGSIDDFPQNLSRVRKFRAFVTFSADLEPFCRNRMR